MSELADKTRSLQSIGIETSETVHWNRSAPFLYEQTVRAGLGRIARGGPLVVDPTPYTGRSPKDNFIVREAASVRMIRTEMDHSGFRMEVHSDAHPGWPSVKPQRKRQHTAFVVHCRSPFDLRTRTPGVRYHESRR